MTKSKSLMRWMVGIGAVLTAGVLTGAEVAIYNPALAGGRAQGITAIATTLDEADIDTAELSSLSLENLLKYRVVIIPNTSKMADNEDPRWIDNLRAYVVECGGALIFNHDSIGAARSPFGQVPLFPEIIQPKSVERVEEGRPQRMDVEIAVRDMLYVGYDYMPGYEVGQRARQMFYDRFVFTQLAGESILACPATRKTVVGLGEAGAGRVVFNGMYGADAASSVAARLDGIDRDVMINTVKWCLAGKDLVITDAAKVEVPEWRSENERPDEIPAAQSRVAFIGEQGLRFALERKAIALGLPSPDFIPLRFLAVRDLSANDYGLIILNAPPGYAERDIPEEALGKIKDYIAAGGKVIVFLPGNIHPRGIYANYFLDKAGSKPLRTVRDNLHYISAVTWNDAEGNTLKLSDGPGTTDWFTPITEPESEDAQLIGYAIDYQGERVSPAIIRMPFGYIINTPIIGDNRLFTTTAAAELLPEVGPDIFRHLTGMYKDTKEQIGDMELSGEGRQKIEQAEKLLQQATAADDKEDYSKANRLALEAERKLVEAYAVSMPSVPDERRMVFTWARRPHAPLDPETICARLANAGFNGLVITHLEGHYPSQLISRNANDPDQETDWMRKWVEAAHRHGLEIGQAISAFTIYPGSETYDRAVTEDWRLVTADMYGRKPSPMGTPYRFDPCRSRPEVVDYAVARVVEIMTNYPVQHMNYDYIRWQQTCYCDYCKDKFQQDTGIKIEEWPGYVMSKYANEFNDWRSRPATDLVRKTAARIAEINPEIKLSFCGFGGESGGKMRGQYWWEWGDYVDFHMPMRYSPVLDELVELADSIAELTPEGSKTQLLPLLAPTAQQRGGTPLLRLKQINIQREYSPAGIMYFAYVHLTDSYLDLLKMGPWRESKSLLEK